MTQAELAERLGVSRQAISKAAKAGRLTLTPEGDIDLKAEITKAYLARFTKHRGKQRREEVSPEAAEALRRKLAAMYHRAAARLTRRKATLIEAAPVAELFGVMLDELAHGLRTMPARVDFGAPELERELERAIVVVMAGAVAAAEAYLATRPHEGGVDPMPDTLPDDAPVADLRAMLDYQAAARHILEAAVEAGRLIPREHVLQRLGQLDTTAFGACRSFPRRIVAELSAVLAAEDQDAARARLAASIESDLIHNLRRIE